MSALKKHFMIADERGAALPYIIAIVFFLSLVWGFALTRTTGEFQWLARKKTGFEQFYSTDAAFPVVYADESYWLNDVVNFYREGNLYNIDPTKTLQREIEDKAGEPLATLTVRQIQNFDPDASAQYNLPHQQHSDFIEGNSIVAGNAVYKRRFGVNAVSPDGSRVIQAGVWVRSK